MSEETVETQKNNPFMLGGIAVALIALLAIGAFALRPSDASPESASATPTASTTVQASSAPSTAPTAQNGQAMIEGRVYSEDGEYSSPAGAENIRVEITLEDNIVTDSKVTVLAQNPISKKKQEEFAASYKAFVIGKNINDIKLDKVAGASLTTAGFNNALEKIKAQVQS